jgi:type II secretory pathway pseudopilin PulG
MIETVVVLVLAGLILGFGVTRLDVFRYRADAGAVQVRALLMQAQRDAIVRQHDLVVSVDVARGRLILGYDKNNDGQLASLERIRTQSLPENTRFAAPPQAIPGSGLTDFGAIRARELRTVSGYPSVVFRRDGSVSTMLELYTTTARGKTTDFRATTVVEATGRTAYLRYTGSSWKAAQ